MPNLSHSRKIDVKTTRFAGRCDNCVYPIIRELPNCVIDTTQVACPECGQNVKVVRLYGVYNDTNCDDRCQYAYGPTCLCACGGAYHSGRHHHLQGHAGASS